MLKYFQDHGGPQTDHSGHLLWPGTADGYPVRSRSGMAPNLRQDEFDQLPLGFDYKSKTFKLWVPEQKAEFDDVMDRIVNGWYLQYKRHDQETTEGYAVWLEWIQVYGEEPSGKSPPPLGAKSDGAPVTLRPGDPASRFAEPSARRQPLADISSDPLGWPAQDSVGRGD